MVALGAPALWCALLLQVITAVVLGLSQAGGPRARDLRRVGLASTIAAGAAMLAAVAALWTALLRNDFSLRYVAQYTSVLLSRQPAIMAFWAGQEGTLLWFTAMLVVSGVVATLLHRRRGALTPIATATVAFVSLAGLIALCVGASPFARLAAAPEEGRGFPPLLLHNGMLVQPPLLLLGLALPVVPFAFVCAQFAGTMGRASSQAVDDAWRGLVQRWLVVAWVCLTAALGVGLWWAQRQLGWFGYYFTWEPYASAPMLAWLAITALLVVLVSEADRASGALWLAAFVAFAFLLALFAVIRLRAGIVASIRAVDARPSTFLVVLTVMGLLLMGALAVCAMRGRAVARARMGGMLGVIGVIILAAGLSASYWRRDLTTGVDIGQVVELRDPFGVPWRFTSQGVSSYQEPAYTVMAVVLNATARNRRAGLLTSQQRQYYDAADNEIYEPLTRVGALTRWNQTVTLAFLGAIDRTSAAVRVSFVPLVSAVWFGLVLSVLGLAVAAWPVQALATDKSRSAVCIACGAARAAEDAHFCTACGAPMAD